MRWGLRTEHGPAATSAPFRYMLCVQVSRGWTWPLKRKSTAVDPFEAFRKMRDTYLEGMSKVMIDAVNSEEYAQASGALLNDYLTLSAPFREALDKAMIMALEQFSLPSRQQVTALAERFTNFEMRLDDLDAKLDRIVELSSATRTPSAGVSAAGTRPCSGKCKVAPGEEQKNLEVDMAGAVELSNDWSVSRSEAQNLQSTDDHEGGDRADAKGTVWTLNKAKLYRYIPVVPATRAISDTSASHLRANESSHDSRSSPGPQLCGIHGWHGAMMFICWIGEFPGRKTRI